MINFTLGPVQMYQNTLNISSQQLPYFRTEEFSNLTKESEYLIKKLANANNHEVLFLSSSGTGAMDATVANIINQNDKCLVINGGTFGNRFCDLLSFYKIQFDEIQLEPFTNITPDVLSKYENKNYDILLVNKLETSTGVLYDMDLIHDFCKRNNIFLIIDNISSFLSDSFDMKESKCDVMICSSQKVLACQPGLSFMILSERAINKIYQTQQKSYYFNLQEALLNNKRYQTPWTCAGGIIMQVNQRLKDIDSIGLQQHIDLIHQQALNFRESIQDIFDIPVKDLSNTLTPIWFNDNAYDIFEDLKNNGLYVSSSGGNFRTHLLRISHIGNLTFNDNDKLIKNLKNICLKYERN